MAHQKPATEIGGSAGIVRCSTVVKPLKNPLTAAVAGVVEQLAVAFRKVDGAQDEESRRVAHLTAGPRCEIDVGNDRIPTFCGVDLAVERASNLEIWPGRSKCRQVDHSSRTGADAGEVEGLESLVIE